MYMQVKSESNLLLKSMACDCLTELEMSFPVSYSIAPNHCHYAENACMCVTI